MNHIPFKCPKCKRIHHNGPISPDCPDIFECENCGRFRLRTDVRTEGPLGHGHGDNGPGAFTLRMVPAAIQLLGHHELALGDLGKALVETLKAYEVLLVEKEEAQSLVKDKLAAVLKFLQDNALVTLPPPAPKEEGVEASGIGTSPSQPDPEQLFTIDVTAKDIGKLIEPMLLEANVAGRHSGRKAVLRSFGVLFDDRSKFHAQAALVAKSPEHHVHQGAMAAFETASKMVIHQAEEGIDHNPKLDS